MKKMLKLVILMVIVAMLTACGGSKTSSNSKNGNHNNGGSSNGGSHSGNANNDGSNNGGGNNTPETTYKFGEGDFLPSWLQGVWNFQNKSSQSSDTFEVELSSNDVAGYLNNARLDELKDIETIKVKEKTDNRLELVATKNDKSAESIVFAIDSGNISLSIGEQNYELTGRRDSIYRYLPSWAVGNFYGYYNASDGSRYYAEYIKISKSTSESDYVDKGIQPYYDHIEVVSSNENRVELKVDNTGAVPNFVFEKMTDGSLKFKGNVNVVSKTFINAVDSMLTTDSSSPYNDNNFIGRGSNHFPDWMLGNWTLQQPIQSNGKSLTGFNIARDTIMTYSSDGAEWIEITKSMDMTILESSVGRLIGVAFVHMGTVDNKLYDWIVEKDGNNLKIVSATFILDGKMWWDIDLKTVHDLILTPKASH